VIFYLRCITYTLLLYLLNCFLFVAAYQAERTVTADERPRLVAQLGHSDKVTSVAFSPDGSYVLTGSYDLGARLWLSETGQELHIFQGHTSWVKTVAFSPNGRVAITGSQDGTARLWSLDSGYEIRRLKGQYPVDAVAFSPDGNLVATGSLDGLVRLWSSESGREVRRLVGHQAGVNSVAFSPDGRYLITGSGSYQRNDNTARLWRVETGQELRRFGNHSSFVNAVAISPSGDSVLTACEDGSVRLWSFGTGTELRRFKGHSYGVKSVAFSTDGLHVFTAGGLDWSVRMWSKDSGQEVRRYPGHFSSVTSVVSSPDGRYLLSGSEDQTARLWDADSGREIHRFGKQLQTVSSVNYSPDGQHILLSGDVLARLWDLSTGQMVRDFKGHSVKPNAQIMLQLAVAYSPDGKYIFTSSQERISRLWSVESGAEIRRFNVHPNFVWSAAFSPDGRYLATGEITYGQTPSGRVRLWLVKDGTEVRRFDGHSDGVQSVAFSPDGRLILSGSRDRTARLWSVETGEALRRFAGGKSPVTSVAFSPDGRYLVTLAGKTAQLRRVKTGQEVKRFQEPRDTLWSVSFSPDGGKIVFGTGPWENSAVLYSVETGDRICRYEGHSGNVTSIAFAPNGKYLLTGSLDNTARLWEGACGQEVGRLISLVDNSWIVVAPDGRFDANNLEEIKGLHWIMPDDQMRPLPIEIFMRDYYEPKFLPRVLVGEEFKPVRELSDLNRVQPKVEIVDVAPENGATDKVTVTVEVSGDERTFGEGGNQENWRTGVYDLRLFRNQQLVGYAPKSRVKLKGDIEDKADLARWRRVNEIKLDRVTDKLRLRFEHIRLSRRQGIESVEFSAYAFNEDRVKSATARKKCVFTKNKKQNVSGGKECVLHRPAPRTGRAYVIAVGVNAYETNDWDLRYAARDAEKLLKVLPPLLEDTKAYASVVKVPLISDWTEGQGKKRKVIQKNAIKAKFKAVLDLLAGRVIDQQLRASIPNADQLQTALPEDLVLIAYSSHGYADQSGRFYLFPYDIGRHAGKKVTTKLLQRTISSDELSVWLRDVDAGELVMIIDACHSAASVEGTGFKPGPMGASGLGQLAYDKGMRILASTRADDVAWESPRTKQGLLSYALVQDGLVDKNADFEPQDEKILLSEWLKYAEKQVPELYARVRGGRGKGADQKAARLASYRRGVGVYYYNDEKIESAAQQPSLFDFRRSAAYETLIMRLGE